MTGEREKEAKESKAPSPPSTTVPIHQGPRLKNPLGDAGNQEEEREAEGRGAEQMEEEQEEGPVIEHSHKDGKPLVPQSAPSLEEIGHELQRKAEAEERNLVRRREIRDKTNRAYKGCGVTFERRGKILQHCWEKHGWRIRVKTEQNPHPLDPQGPPGHWSPTLKTSPRKGGLNIPPTPGQEGPGKTAQNQLGDKPNVRGMKLGALQPPGTEKHEASQQPR